MGVVAIDVQVNNSLKVYNESFYNHTLAESIQLREEDESPL
jgi:hypothetical protein